MSQAADKEYYVPNQFLPSFYSTQKLPNDTISLRNRYRIILSFQRCPIILPTNDESEQNYCNINNSEW